MTHNTETHGHTPRDAAELRAAGIDPFNTQPREQPVRCFEVGCGKRTFHLERRCDTHYVAPAVRHRLQS